MIKNKKDTAIVTYALLVLINLIPGLTFRCSEEYEVLGMDETEIGEVRPSFPFSFSFPTDLRFDYSSPTTTSTSTATSTRTVLLFEVVRSSRRGQWRSASTRLRRRVRRRRREKYRRSRRWRVAESSE
jgi:hypothetical protein